MKLYFIPTIIGSIVFATLLSAFWETRAKDKYYYMLSGAYLTVLAAIDFMALKWNERFSKMVYTSFIFICLFSFVALVLVNVPLQQGIGYIVVIGLIVLLFLGMIFGFRYVNNVFSYNEHARKTGELAPLDVRQKRKAVKEQIGLLIDLQKKHELEKLIPQEYVIVTEPQPEPQPEPIRKKDPKPSNNYTYKQPKTQTFTAPLSPEEKYPFEIGDRELLKRVFDTANKEGIRKIENMSLDSPEITQISIKAGIKKEAVLRVLNRYTAEKGTEVLLKPLLTGDLQNV